ncbi:ABC transporter permease [Pararhizobium sp. YC-54]|uniref:ABC transporter permease n=1 Tax=Pararhizobium sp. YC-54 TaxID=2986920 RepID=UPI0021F6FE8D|nr:ABC transporter permease [Pararhizobium sp. YC-54]MCW0002289.1 ABC transporter permease [Pararhizobium sp. YC-54]
MISIQRRSGSSLRWNVVCFSAAILGAFLSSATLLALSGGDAVKAFSALFTGAFGSQNALFGSLAKATPLLLVGLGTVIAFRAKIWNIGQEGQVLAGAMMAYWASLMVGSLPYWLALSVIALAGLSGGGILGLLAGYLKTRFHTNEVISTVMLNYIVIFFLAYLLDGGPWMETGVTVAYHQSPPVNPALEWPELFARGAGKLHIGFLFALAASAFCAILIDRTSLGYDIRAFGSNPTALRFRGTNVRRLLLVVMLLSGALAGLAGAGELFGTSHRLRAETLLGIGSSGIVVAMVGGLRPSGVMLAALFFGALKSGAIYMRLQSGTPAGLVSAMEGLVLLFFLCAAVATKFQIVRSNVHA